jgi:hypothetical protein
MSITFQPQYHPTTHDVSDAFREEIASLGGTVTDVVLDERYLLARAVLARSAEVRPGDRINGGVAIRAIGAEVMVHPYTFRQVCTNGAIAAQALESRRVVRVEGYVSSYDVALMLEEIQEAIRTSARPEAFTRSTDQMRGAMEMDADVSIQLIPHLTRLPQQMVESVLRSILGRFASEDDRSAFGLMNAVTSVARDTRDAELRWKLEEIGALIPAHRVPLEVIERAGKA